MIWLFRLLEIMLAWIPFDKVVGLFYRKEHPVFSFLDFIANEKEPYSWFNNNRKRYLAHVFCRVEAKTISEFLKKLEKDKTVLCESMLKELCKEIEMRVLFAWEEIAPKNKAMSVLVKKLNVCQRNAIKSLSERISFLNGNSISDKERVREYLVAFYFEMGKVFLNLPVFILSLNGELQKPLDKLGKDFYTDK